MANNNGCLGRIFLSRRVQSSKGPSLKLSTLIAPGIWLSVHYPQRAMLATNTPIFNGYNQTHITSPWPTLTGTIL